MAQATLIPRAGPPTDLQRYCLPERETCHQRVVLECQKGVGDLTGGEEIRPALLGVDAASAELGRKRNEGEGGIVRQSGSLAVWGSLSGDLGER